MYYLGISSGVFCVIFGIYEKLINSILYFFSDINNNVKFLFLIGFGILTGIFISANILLVLFNNFFMPLSFAFIGLILGSIPLVLKQSKLSKISFTHILCMLVFLSFSLYLTVLGKTLNYTLDVTSSSYLFLGGFLMSAGIVIPGVCKTAILMILGIYETYLTAISSLDLHILIPIGFGLIFGGIIFLVLLHFLFKYAKSYTYYAIIGFIIGSIFVIYPGFTFNIEGLISILLLLLCFVISLKLG